MMPKFLQGTTVKFRPGKKAETDVKSLPAGDGGRDCFCYTHHDRRLHLSQLGMGRGSGKKLREPDPAVTE